MIAYLAVFIAAVALGAASYAVERSRQSNKAINRILAEVLRR